MRCHGAAPAPAALIFSHGDGIIREHRIFLRLKKIMKQAGPVRRIATPKLPGEVRALWVFVCWDRALLNQPDAPGHVRLSIKDAGLQRLA